MDDHQDSGDTIKESLKIYEQLQDAPLPSGSPEVLHLDPNVSAKENSLKVEKGDSIQCGSMVRPYASSESSDSEVPGLGEVKDIFDALSVSDDEAIGCPLPSTPEDESAFVSEITETLKAGVLADEIDLTSLAQNPTQETEKFVLKVCDSWRLCCYNSLPAWMQDNDFVIGGYRPPTPSFYACFKSIFKLHTETANIWTHLLACIAFIAMAIHFLSQTSEVLELPEKVVFSTFFLGAILCFGLSSAYHILHCHSECIGRLFSKLDYCGIALLIIGSFVPWLYYSFYCQFHLTVIYLSIVVIFGITSIVVSLWEKFSEPRFRPLRAGLFLAFGLSGLIPAVHYAIKEGWMNAVSHASLHWLFIMGGLYVVGALIYAWRVPERFFPGMCDIWFQSHQIFHVFVIAGAIVHYHGISEMAMYRLTYIDCGNPIYA
ncbi:ADIPOR-like receptor [Gryllus bimaculatus]|nr:ADIPOR-like receptor [Gryllus bimaculatus]